MKKVFVSAFLCALVLAGAGQAQAGTKASASLPDVRSGHLPTSDADRHLASRDLGDPHSRDSQGRVSNDRGAGRSDNGKHRGTDGDWKSHGC